MTDTAKPPPAPAFVAYFSATLNHGLATLNLYGQSHDALGASPVPVSAAALVFRAEELRSMAAIIDELLQKVGWTEPAPPQAQPAAPAQGVPAAPQPEPAPARVQPLPPVFVSNFTASFVDGMIIASFFAHAEQEIGRAPVLIPVAAAAFRARDAKGFTAMIHDLFRKGEMMVQLKDAPTSGVQ